MGWKPEDFYRETLADIQIALAAHYDRIEFEATNQMSVLRRLTYFIVNTNGFLKKEIGMNEILELPNERAERLRRKAANQFTQEEIDKWLKRWQAEGPEIPNGVDATQDLMMLMK